MKSFITGISGFVGQYLARHLVEIGETVTGIDLRPGAVADCTVSDCDILDFEKLSAIIKECEPVFVYHLAGLVHPKDSLTRPRDYYRTNVLGTVNLLEALRQNGIDARVLIVSSSKVYGQVSPEVDLIDETLDPKPQTPYAVSKYLAEQVALQYFLNYGTRVIIARPFNHTGPGQPLGFVVPDFCKQIAEIEALPPAEQATATLQFGDLSPVRDFLDVRDVVRAYEAVIKKGDAGECFNVCSGSGVQIREVFELILKSSGLSNKLPASRQAGGLSGGIREIGTPRKLKESTGWSPRFVLQNMTEETLAHWRNLTKGDR